MRSRSVSRSPRSPSPRRQRADVAPAEPREPSVNTWPWPESHKLFCRSCKRTYPRCRFQSFHVDQEEIVCACGQIAFAWVLELD